MDVGELYSKYLDKHLKANGDSLMSSTKERYLAFAMPYFDRARNMSRPDFLEFAIKEMKRNESGVRFAAMKHLLESMGFTELEVARVQAPNHVRAHAATSKRFLQQQVLSRNELQSLVAHADSDEEKLLVLLFTDTGCRRAELCSIKFRDIDFHKEDSIESMNKINKGIHATIEVTGKGNKKRKVFLHRSTVVLIKRMHRQHPWNPDDALVRFVNKKAGEGRRLYSKNPYQLIDYRINNLGRRALGRKINAHMFRHSKATHLADSGASINQIQAILGHENVMTTQIYIHISSHLAEQAFKQYSKPVIN